MEISPFSKEVDGVKWDVAWENGEPIITKNGKPSSMSELPGSIMAAAKAHSKNYTPDDNKTGTEENKTVENNNESNTAVASENKNVKSGKNAAKAVFSWKNGQFFEPDGKTPLSEDRKKDLEKNVYHKSLDEVVKNATEGHKVAGGRGAFQGMIKSDVNEAIKSVKQVYQDTKTLLKNGQYKEVVGKAVKGITQFIDDSVNAPVNHARALLDKLKQRNGQPLPQTARVVSGTEKSPVAHAANKARGAGR